MNDENTNREPNEANNEGKHGNERERTYRARDRAEQEGRDNNALERIDRELRERLAEEYGEPFILRNEEGSGISRVNAAFYAALFAAKHDVLREIMEDRVYRYEEQRGLWVRESAEETFGKIDKLLLRESRREGAQGLAGKRCVALVRDIYTYLKGLSGVVKRDVFTRDPDREKRIIHFKNGVFVFQDGKAVGFRKEFHRDYYSRNQIPIDYDPKADCPRTIDELLRPALPQETFEEDLALLFRFLGIFLYGINLPQRILILDGAAGSGKSTISKLAGLLIGRENVAQLRPAQLKERFELSAYIGKTLLLGSDVDPKFLLTRGADVLKSLVGGDCLEAESKQGNDRTSLDGVYNVLINTNMQLRVRLAGDEDAWRRRLAIIHFVEHEPRERIRNFAKVLFEEEAPGIVNRALQGLQEVLDAGGSLGMTEVQKQRVEDLLERSEPLAEFLRDRVTGAEGEALPKKLIRERFREFCKERRWSVPPEREIGGRLPELMRELFGAEESNSVRGYKENGEMGDVTGYRGVSWRDD